MISSPNPPRLPRRLRRFLTATLTLVLAVAPAPAATRVKLATLVPKGTSFHQILLEMGQAWKDATDGAVQLTIYTDGTMGTESDMVKRMQLGQLQAGLLTAAGLVDLNPNISGLQNIPMAFRSLDEAAYVREKLAPRYEQEVEKKGFVILGWVDWGWVHVFSKKPLRTPADLRGEKVFVWVGATDAANIVRSLGMQPVELNPPDILVSLQTGLITVVPSPPIYALAGQFYQPAPHMLEINWSPLVGGLVVTKRMWNRLKPEQQQAMRTSAEEACRKITQRGRQEMKESVEAMEKRGLVVQELDGELLQQWRDFSESIYPEIRGRVVPPAAFDEIMSLLRDYRANHPSEN